MPFYCYVFECIGDFFLIKHFVLFKIIGCSFRFLLIKAGRLASNTLYIVILEEINIFQIKERSRTAFFFNTYVKLAAPDSPLSADIFPGGGITSGPPDKEALHRADGGRYLESQIATVASPKGLARIVLAHLVAEPMGAEGEIRRE